MKTAIRNQQGLTLIELMLALVMSSILIAGIYRVFLYQQQTYTAEEQVSDMQQNVRGGVNRMMREIRMAGFGGVSSVVDAAGGMHGAFKFVVNPGATDDQVTVVAGYEELGVVQEKILVNSNVIKVKLTDDTLLDDAKKQYLSINGTESHRIQKVKDEGGGIFSVTLKKDDPKDTFVVEEHLPGEPVFRVTAISYGLGMSFGKPVIYRDTNLGGGNQPLAENIESLRFQYLMRDGSLRNRSELSNADKNDPLSKANIRTVQVRLVARTEAKDPTLQKTGDGYRRREINTNIQLRNLAYVE